MVVILMVLYISFGIFIRKIIVNLSLDSAVLEVTWTIIPIIVLVTIAIPRLNLLCLQDIATISPKLRIKLIRNQWNWQREQRNSVDHLLDVEKFDELRRYETPLLIARKMLTRILLTRRDVLHSLGVPSLGLKLDSTPGRLNSVIFESIGKGLFTGSCYELCGSGHRAMPIFFLSL